MPPQLHSLYLLDTAIACYLHFQVNQDLEQVPSLSRQSSNCPASSPFSSLQRANSFQPQFRIFSLPVRYTDWKPSCRHYVQPHISLSHHMQPQSLQMLYHIIKFNRDINLIIRLLFQLGQKNNRLHVARYILIDVSFREPIQTNMKCSKISPFVCRNISTNSVAKKY